MSFSRRTPPALRRDLPGIFCVILLGVMLPGRTMLAQTNLLTPETSGTANHTFTNGASASDPAWEKKTMEEYRREQFGEHALEIAENLRKRVVLPASMLRNVEDLSPKVHYPSSPRIALAPPAAAYDNRVFTLAMMVIAMATAILVAGKLVPEFAEYLRRSLQPWRLLPAMPGDASPLLLEEQKSVDEFQEKFRAASPQAEAEEAAGADGGFGMVRRQVEDLQKLLTELNLSAAERIQRMILLEIIDKLAPLKTLSSRPELRPIFQIVTALELLLKRMAEKPNFNNSSVLRTLAQSLSVMVDLCRPDLNPNLLVDPPLRILVVDDEAFSRFALCQSLERTLNKPEIAERPSRALELAREHKYDLIFSDVMMPEMDGFELCPKIHETELNAATPVVFVTSLHDLNARSKAVLSGGRDFITKPFQVFEVTLKALAMVTHERLHGRQPVVKESTPQPVLETVS